MTDELLPGFATPKLHKKVQPIAEVYRKAGLLLQQAGFIHAHHTEKTDLYRLPSRFGYIRTSVYPGSQAVADRRSVMVRLVFTADGLLADQEAMRISDAGLKNMVCAAIGRFMIASNAP